VVIIAWGKCGKLFGEELYRGLHFVRRGKSFCYVFTHRETREMYLLIISDDESNLLI